MDANIDPSTYEQIEKLISSADSPVGIDAKKTHVLILHKLTQIEQRLARLEQHAATNPKAGRGSSTT
ncbi:hypothetical protein ACERK3_13220 [Phycisphaerales bacterium AB-hyl4]|uniref:Transposase n=1 Tax=Natronomicrosphaera hydrolytica TaxID=3242702 RepID=A0ABV4U816_9BACT